jgi:hypothetical protein
VGKHSSNQESGKHSYDGKHRPEKDDKTAEIRVNFDKNHNMTGFGVGRQTGKDDYTDR